MSDGIKKNWNVVRGQIADYKFECKLIRRKINKEHNIWRKLHHASGYLEEALDQMPRLWFYTWFPKWAFIGYVIWSLYREANGHC